MDWHPPSNVSSQLSYNLFMLHWCNEEALVNSGMKGFRAQTNGEKK